MRWEKIGLVRGYAGGKKRGRSCDKFNMEKSENININVESGSKSICNLYKN